MVNAARGNLRLDHAPMIGIGRKRRPTVQATPERMVAARELESAGLVRVSEFSSWVSIVKLSS